MCQFFFNFTRESRVEVSACNQMSSAAKKATITRRVQKGKKSFSSCSNQTQVAPPVSHQTNNLLPSTSSEKLIQGPKYMNTYRLESKNPFNCTLVHGVIEEIVQKQCSGMKYDPIKCVSKVQSLAGEILHRVKNFEFDRYRFVVLVQITSNQSQEFGTAVNFLWDSAKDKFVTYNLKSGSMFTTATCFGIYQD